MVSEPVGGVKICTSDGSMDVTIASPPVQESADAVAGVNGVAGVTGVAEVGCVAGVGGVAVVGGMIASSEVVV